MVKKLQDYTICSRYNRNECINGKITLFERTQKLINSPEFIAEHPYFSSEWAYHIHIFDKILGDIAKLYTCNGPTNPQFVEHAAKELHDSFVVYFKITRQNNPTIVWPPILTVIGQIKYDNLLPNMKKKQRDYINLLMKSNAITACA